VHLTSRDNLKVRKNTKIFGFHVISRTSSITQKLANYMDRVTSA